MAGIHASAYINGNRDTDKHPDPIALLVPWSSREGEEEQVTEEELVRLRADLQSRSAFAE